MSKLGEQFNKSGGDSEWINSYTYMLQTATNLGLIPICNVDSVEWLSCFSERDSD